MFGSKHIEVKRHSVYFPEIKKTFAVSPLVSNLLSSQIGEFFLPYPVDALISQIYFWSKSLHVSDSSSVHHQKFFTVHIAMVHVIKVC